MQRRTNTKILCSLIYSTELITIIFEFSCIRSSSLNTVNFDGRFFKLRVSFHSNPSSNLPTQQSHILLRVLFASHHLGGVDIKPSATETNVKNVCLQPQRGGSSRLCSSLLFLYFVSLHVPLRDFDQSTRLSRVSCACNVYGSFQHLQADSCAHTVCTAQILASRRLQLVSEVSWLPHGTSEILPGNVSVS